jgi:hypothetical protein
VPSKNFQFTQKPQNYNPKKQNTLMKIQNSITTTVRAIALTSAFSLVAVSAAQAAFVPLPTGTPETPGVVLDPNTAGLTGTVLAVRDASFADTGTPPPLNTGVLRSFVVDSGGGLLDFYYQLVSTANPAEELFRIKSIGGFSPGLALSVAQTNSLGGLVAGAGSGFVAGSYTQGGGLEGASTADRDVGSAGSVGFDLSNPPAFFPNPSNIQGGETGTFLVIRTNSSQYGDVTAQISGSGGTSLASTFAAVPEPGSMIFGLAVLGTCFVRNRRSQARSI